MLSVGRIGFFLLFLTGLLLGYYKHTTFYILGIISLFLFIALVYAYSSQKQKERYLLAQEQVLTRMLDRKTGSWKTFSENGEKFLNENSPPRGKDLDLLGKNSLYQYLCRCHTAYGRQMLAIRLLSDVPNRETINSNQQAIKELSQKEDFCLELEAVSYTHLDVYKRQPMMLAPAFIAD